MLLDIQPLLEIAEGLHYMSEPAPERAVGLYPYVIDFLMSMDDKAIRDMASTLWELVSKNAVMITTSPRENLTFVVDDLEGLIHQAVIILPENWVTLFRTDPIFNIGGVLYTGSQAIDFYNGRLIGQQEEATLRSQAYEAEILYRTRLEIPQYLFQPYQEQVMEKFPLGLSSIAAGPLIYRSAPVVVIEA